MIKYDRILLEGGDNAGKTTIGKALAEKLGWTLRGRIIRVGPEKVVEAHREDMKCTQTIMDRSYFISDMVYERVLDKVSVFSPIRGEMEDEMRRSKTAIIHVVCSEEDIRSRYEKEGDDIHNLKEILEAHRGYRNFFYSTYMPHLVVSTTRRTTEQNVKEIIKYLGGN